MCRSDNENNEIQPENYESDMKNAILVAITIDGACQNQKRYELTHC